jgi:uncharacterized SAM-binding protein YcdF (DUF218 family)
MMRSRMKKIVIGILLAGFVWGAVLATMIWRFGLHDHAAESDCIIVLGAAVRGDQPSPVFEERLHHAIKLYHAGLAAKLLFTGGVGDGQELSEGEVARRFAVQHAVPSSDILIEERSRTTKQNLSEAQLVMGSQGLRSAIIVSDPLHMKRALMMAKGLGLDAVSSPTPSSRYRSVRTKLGFLARELYFYHHYLVTGN